jgi:hypothetical protein
VSFRSIGWDGLYLKIDGLWHVYHCIADRPPSAVLQFIEGRLPPGEHPIIIFDVDLGFLPEPGKQHRRVLPNAGWMVANFQKNGVRVHKKSYIEPPCLSGSRFGSSEPKFHVGDAVGEGAQLRNFRLTCVVFC